MKRDKEKYMEEDYDHVYAIAVSRKTVNELDRERTWGNGETGADN